MQLKQDIYWQFPGQARSLLYRNQVCGGGISFLHAWIFCTACCYGMPTHSHFAIVFHDSDFAPNNIPLVPTQLISSGLDFLHCLLLLYAAKKCKKQGQVVSLYLICYSLGRFVLEFFRGDLNRGAVGSLSTSQFISLFIFAAGVAMFAFCGKRTEVPLEK